MYECIGKRTNKSISLSFLCGLLRFVLQCNNEVWTNILSPERYCTMGRPMAVYIASVFMTKFEEELGRQSNPYILWLQLTDNVFLVREGSQDNLINF